mgnify:CR=1 FL=1
MSRLNEDTLVQQTTADYLQNELGWECVNALAETYGPQGLLGRDSEREVVLTGYLWAALEKLNPGLPESAYTEAIRQIREYSSSQTLLATNQDKYALCKDGVQVAYRDGKGELVRDRLRLFDFNNPGNNHWLCVREFWIQGDVYRRRADIVGFVNGIPLLFMELKSPAVGIQAAYERNFTNYKSEIPQLFHHNAFVVIADGIEAKAGTISSSYKHFYPWKRLDESEPGQVDMETLLKGMCSKDNFLDLFENFLIFDDSSGRLAKILAQNQQFLGVNRAIKSLERSKEQQGKLGVYWHTQGAGKSYSIVFFTRKVHRKLGGNYTFVICTDRDDLDTQIYQTFAGCGLVDNDRDPCRAATGEHLEELIGQHKAYVFTLIHKFNRDVDPKVGYSLRDDVVVITDEAHRSQYGRLALNLRNALPNASYIGFTGTPLFKDDEITRRVFGDYVSTYGFQRAVEDKATVPLYYDARGDKLGVATNEMNERIAERLEQYEADSIDVEQRLERELRREYHVLTAKKRLRQIAADFVQHYSTGWETGKAMLVCIDKVTCLRMYNLIREQWERRIIRLEAELKHVVGADERAQSEQHLAWMRATKIAVIVSEEQGEAEKFMKWGLDIIPHRKLIKEGFVDSAGERIDVETAFKNGDHQFRVAIVCAMWLTGFDVPSLGTLYLDKPLKAHTLMQAIARANRVADGKDNGLIVDYCGILKNLRQALATFANGPAAGGNLDEPTRPIAELLALLAESIQQVRDFLRARGASLDTILQTSGFERNAAILIAKEAANENDETRKRFEIMCRQVFSKFKACLNEPGINDYRHDYDAINIIYRSLEHDREQADISDIIRELQQVVDDSIRPIQDPKLGGVLYDISAINFDHLRQEFARTQAKRTTVQNLKYVIEQKLARLLSQNPLRTNYQAHYEEIVSAYNSEKDRQTIEATFEALMQFAEDLTEEEQRAMREGLDEESLAVFDLLAKPDLTAKEIKHIKQVAKDLLATLKAEKLNISHWTDKESTRDAVLIAIRDYLWDGRKGLPQSYTPEEVQQKADYVFQHVRRAYPRLPSPIYQQPAS